MASVLQVFADMLRLRSGPQDLPASDSLLLGSVIVVTGASMLAIRRIYPVDLAFARIGIDLVLQLAFVLVALQATGRPERFRQTFSALCGTGALLVLLSWPLLDIVLDNPRGHPLKVFGSFALLGLYGWSVLVVGHILRHALDLRLGFAVLIALGYVILSVLVGDTLVPAPEPS